MSEPDPGEAARYVLAEADNDRIFAQRIVPHLLAGRARQDQPTVVFLVGQPGAGKSRVAAAVAEQLDPRGGFVEIDTDLYKPYHPAYDELMQQDDHLAAAAVGPDGQRWKRQAMDYVRAHRINALIHETAQNPPAPVATMSDYSQAGFRVEVLLLGVHHTMSNQGVLNRYYEQVRERGHGRLTVQAKADLSYLGILKLAAAVDEQHLADYVAVYSRGEPNARYHNRLAPDRQSWTEPPQLRAAIMIERDRPWTPAETRDFLDVQRKLHREMRTEWQPRLDAIESAAAGCYTPAPGPKSSPYRRTPQAGRPVLPSVQRTTRSPTSLGDTRTTPAGATGLRSGGEP